MKMVKSLLLGSAAGVVAVTMGQAADLPVKAKPVEYVKVCSLYGAGFYYMPGTDLCIKIGGWVRAEALLETNQTGSIAWGPWNDNLQERSTNHFQVRARGYITADAREQTAYGTARGYIAVGTNNSDIGSAGTNTFSSNRAFVQWAGITAGLSQSFYDFYSSAATAYRGFIVSEDSGDGGWWVWAYTAQLGNGVSATISAESRRQMQIVDFSGAGGTLTGGMGVIAGTGANGLGYGGWQAPDIVGNVRVDQTWGSAQVMAAAHEVNPLYYGSAVPSTPAAGNFGHPGDTWGWVVGAGLKLNFPMIAQGDYFQGEVNYTEGAIRYLMHGVSNNVMSILAGNQQTFGIATDCVFGGTVATGTNTGCNLTTGWSVNAAYEHYWTPQWHQSLFGGYAAVKYNSQANALLCNGAGFGNGALGNLAVAAPGCGMNFNVWGLGSRLQWDVTKTFYLGVEVLYDRLNGASTPGGVISPALAINAAQVNVNKTSQNNWSGTLRIHKDFLP